MARTRFDRSTQDVGNIVLLEHVNLQVPDQIMATEFYVAGLGLTRDPYLRVGTDNMWVNLGRHQFHLPTGEPQCFRGIMGIVLTDLDALLGRLEAVAPRLEETSFRFAPHGDRVDVTCPWGNRFRVHRTIENFGDARGIAYLESDVPAGSAKAIARFYGSCLGAPSRLLPDDDRVAEICVGPGQRLVYRDATGDGVAYDGHHIAIYVADFSGPHHWLSARGLVSREDNAHQYRFDTLVGPRGKKPLWQLEHEIRSLHHPLWQRALVNRGAA